MNKLIALYLFLSLAITSGFFIMTGISILFSSLHHYVFTVHADDFGEGPIEAGMFLFALPGLTISLRNAVLEMAG